MSFVAIFSDPSEIDDPFQWKPKENLESVPEDMIGRLSLKIEEKTLEEEIELESIILNLALSYEDFILGNVEKSREILRNMLVETTRLKKYGGGNRSRLLAMEHLLLSALTHITIYSENAENIRTELDRIPRISSMDAKSKAALCGFRASFYAEYGIYGSKAALAFAEKALQMDPHESLWYFVKGKLLGRVRRVEKPFDIPSPDELYALETALEKDSNAAYAIFTAQVYRETANRAFRKNKDAGRLYPNLKEIIDKMNAKSYELYEKSLSLNPYCSHIKFRCAKGFMSLPPPFRNTDLAKKCIVEGLKMAPTSAYGNHVMAMYYERYEKDIRSAVNYLKICIPLRVFGAYVDLLRLEFLYYDLSKNAVLQRLNELYETFTETPRRCQTLSQFVSYYLFVDYVLEEAIKYLVQVFRLNLCCDDVYKHRSLFLDLRFTFSLLEVVVDETKIRLDDANCSSATRDTCNGFLSDLAELNVAYARNRPLYMRQRLLEQNGLMGRGAAIGTAAGRHFGKGGGRDRGGARSRGQAPSTNNATVSYVRRRNQQAAADRTLQKIDELTTLWKKALKVGAPTSADDVAVSGVARRTELENGDRNGSNSSSSSNENEERAKSPADECDSDSDFEKSVLAYRRAKQAAGAAAGGRPSPDKRFQTRFVFRASQLRNDSSSASAQLPHVASTGATRRRGAGKKGGGNTFDGYLARSAAELDKKFEPGQIKF